MNAENWKPTGCWGKNFEDMTKEELIKAWYTLWEQHSKLKEEHRELQEEKFNDDCHYQEMIDGMR